MIDTGALGNLMGSCFFMRVKTFASRFRLQTIYQRMSQALGVEGVGKNAQECTHQGTLPVALEDASVGEFTAPIIENSEVPGILGLVRMEQQRAIIDTFGKKYIVPGPNGVEMKLSPGSKIFNLKKAMSGHLMLPVTKYEQAVRSEHTTLQKRSVW